MHTSAFATYIPSRVPLWINRTIRSGRAVYAHVTSSNVYSGSARYANNFGAKRYTIECARVSISNGTFYATLLDGGRIALPANVCFGVHR